MKKVIYIFFILACTLRFSAQDLHFSQFNEQPALVNPALTGATAPSRMSIAYRNQWRSISTPFVSIGASAETRFNASEWQQVDKFRSMTFKKRTTGRLAAGLSVYRDNAGDGKMGSTQVNLSFSSFVPTGKKSLIAVGLQGGWAQYMVNSEKLIFPNQYNGYGYDAGMNSNESFYSQSYSYFDFGGGALWTYGQNDRSLLGKRQLKGNAGASFYHISKDKSFLTSGRRDANMKFVVHGDLLVSLTNPDFAIAPSFIFQMRGVSKEVLAGFLLKRYIKIDSKYTGIIKRSSLGAGVYYRNNDAAILYVALELKEQCVIGVSYDINISRLTTGTNARGGFELTMRYTPPRAFLYQNKEVKQPQ